MNMQMCYINGFLNQQMYQAMLQSTMQPLFSIGCNCLCHQNNNYNMFPLYTFNFPKIKPISLPQHFNIYPQAVIDNPFIKFSDHPNYQTGNYFPMSESLYLPQTNYNNCSFDMFDCDF